MRNIVWISFEKDFPSWSDYILDTPSQLSLDEHIEGLVKAIEWCSNERVKALKIEVDNSAPILRIINRKEK